MILSPESIVEINHIWRLSYNLPPPNLLILLLLEDFFTPWIIFDMKSTWNFGCANQHFPSPWLNIHQKSTGGHVRPFAATNLLTKLPRSHGRSLSSPDPHLGFDGIQELVRVRLAALLGSKEIMWVWHFVNFKGERWDFPSHTWDMSEFFFVIYDMSEVMSKIDYDSNLNTSAEMAAGW